MKTFVLEFKQYRDMRPSKFIVCDESREIAKARVQHEHNYKDSDCINIVELFCKSPGIVLTL